MLHRDAVPAVRRRVAGDAGRLLLRVAADTDAGRDPIARANLDVAGADVDLE
jgi:hypothetical protein